MYHGARQTSLRILATVTFVVYMQVPAAMGGYFKRPLALVNQFSRRYNHREVRICFWDSEWVLKCSLDSRVIATIAHSLFRTCSIPVTIRAERTASQSHVSNATCWKSSRKGLSELIKAPCTVQRNDHVTLRRKLRLAQSYAFFWCEKCGSAVYSRFQLKRFLRRRDGLVCAALQHIAELWLRSNASRKLPMRHIQPTSTKSLLEQ